MYPCASYLGFGISLHVPVFSSMFANLAPMVLELRVTSFLSTICQLPCSDDPDTSTCLPFRNNSELLRTSLCFKAFVTNMQHGFCRLMHLIRSFNVHSPKYRGFLFVVQSTSATLKPKHFRCLSRMSNPINSGRLISTMSRSNNMVHPSLYGTVHTENSVDLSMCRNRTQ